MPAIDTATTVVEPSTQVTFQQIGDETVLLDLQTEQYFSLDGIGARIWGWIAEGVGIAEIEARLIDGYDAPAATIRADLAGLIEQLAEAGLVRLASKE
jgi:hypothetical protein